jgi:hypothetical protein
MLSWEKLKRAFVLVSLLAVAVSDARAAGAPPVVVELFTSQGCSSCPPADAFLGELAARPGVLALAFHVDYWNYIGWADPFASKLATERQRNYAKQLRLRYVYTPQMVINGATEGIGSEREIITRLIADAAADGRPHVGVTMARDAGGQLLVHVDSGQAGEPATVWLIGFDREHETHVQRGENEGRVLKDVQVVRSLKPVGTWSGAALDLTLAEGAAVGDGGVGVLVQLANSGRIIGAACIKTPTS